MTTGPAWLPSHDRTIPLFGYAARAPIGRQAAVLPRVWPSMAPGDGLDFTVDATGWAALTGDPIASASAAVVPSDVTVVATVLIGDAVVLWLAGGAPGPHVVTVTVTTASGQVVAAPVALLIDAGVAALSPTPPAFMTEAGAAVLTEAADVLAPSVGQLGATVTLPTGAVLSTQAGVPLF